MVMGRGGVGEWLKLAAFEEEAFLLNGGKAEGGQFGLAGQAVALGLALQLQCLEPSPLGL
jgi:hypothetical protein